MIAFEGAESALEVLLDLGAVAEEVFVDQVVGVAGGLEEADGESFVGLGVGVGGFGGFDAFCQLGLVESLEPGPFGAGEALRNPVALDEALDEYLLGDAFGLEVVEDGLLELVVVGLAFEG